MTVWIVSLEWNQPPSEVTGDTGIVGVFAEEGQARTCQVATQREFDEDCAVVYEFSKLPGRHCLACGELNMADGTPHVCDVSPEVEDFCDRCGAELTDNATCENDHDDWDIDVHCTEHDVQEVFRG